MKTPKRNKDKQENDIQFWLYVRKLYFKGDLTLRHITKRISILDRSKSIKDQFGTPL